MAKELFYAIKKLGSREKNGIEETNISLSIQGILLFGMLIDI